MKVLNSLLLMILLAFVSCGKNKVVNSSIVDSLASVSPVNTQMAQNLSEYKQFIESDRFVKVSISYDFELFKMTNGVTVDKCFFNLLDCTSTSSNKSVLGSETRTETLNSESVTHSLGSTRTAVRTQMVNLLAQAVSGYNYGYGRFVIALSNGETYYFDLNLPMSANPTSRFNYATGEGYSLQSGGGWYTIQ